MLKAGKEEYVHVYICNTHCICIVIHIYVYICMYWRFCVDIDICIHLCICAHIGIWFESSMPDVELKRDPQRSPWQSAAPEALAWRRSYRRSCGRWASYEYEYTRKNYICICMPMYLCTGLCVHIYIYTHCCMCHLHAYEY